MSDRYADPEALLARYLTQAVGVSTRTTLPPKLELSLPWQRVTVVGGGDDGITDEPLLDLESFHRTRGEAADLAEDTRQAMLKLRGMAVVLPGVRAALVDDVEVAVRPRWVDYENPAVERFVATYRVRLRRPVA